MTTTSNPGVLGDHVNTPPPPMSPFWRAVIIFTIALIILAAMFGNAH